MKIKQLKQDQFNKQKQCLKLLEFKFEGGLGLKRGKSNSHAFQSSLAYPSPLKILAKKMSMASESASNSHAYNEQTATEKKQQIEEQQFQQKRDDIFKKMLTPRDALFQPRRSVFNRFNYENYENYEYQNPFKPKKYPINDKIKKALKNNPNQGSAKNLQIIFCEHKYQQFVQKSNKKIQQFYQTSREFPVVKSPKKRVYKSQLNLNRNQGEQKIYSKTSLNFKKRKTTLSNFLQQFTTLQKLSQYMIREQKLNEKYLLHSMGDPSRTVLLQILIHRFQFLKKMKKRGRDLIFKILLGVESLNPVFKINIQDYIKFIQLFVSRDAEPNLVALFTYKFLFKNEEDVNMESALSCLNLIENSNKKHKYIQERLSKILEQNKNKPLKVYESIRKDQNFLNTFIDLIITNI